jgi:hypothetical protein
MSTTISNDLYDLDYSDKFELVRTARTYNYELTASGGGRVSFKIEWYSPPLLGEVGVSGHWYDLEDKSKVASGTTLNGSFTVPKHQIDSSSWSDQTQLRLTFSREFASAGVSYKLFFEPA